MPGPAHVVPDATRTPPATGPETRLTERRRPARGIGRRISDRRDRRRSRHPAAGHAAGPDRCHRAHRAVDRARHGQPTELRALRWLERFGPKACLLSWLPGVGDPLCAVAGWLRFPFWPCVLYMAIGKFARYLTMTAALLWLFPGGLSF